MKTLSIIIPVFNEKGTINEILQRIEGVQLPDMEKEIIIIDDCSTDGTREILRALSVKYRIFYHDRNQGKGVAVRRGFHEATGDFIVIQDADLEYNPEDYARLLQPVLDGKADVVYGSRLVTNQPHRVLFFWHYLGNTFLTFLSNMFTNLNLTDMETCYKLFTRRVIDEIKNVLMSERFGIEPEITARIKKYRVYEIGISYSGRTYAEGKKINWKDGCSAIFSIIRYNLFL